jgi:hypothetical protein
VKGTLDERPSIFIRGKSIFSSERMLHKNYGRKGSVGKRKFGSRGLTPRRTDELIGCKPPVVKKL